MTNEGLLKDLAAARRPVFLIGGGARQAARLCRLVGTHLRIPCIPTWNAVDIFTNDFMFYRGRIGTYGTRYGNFTIQNSDLILAVGCRFSGRITGGYISSFARGAKIYAVDIDNSQLKHSTIVVHVPIHSDAVVFLSSLLNDLRRKNLQLYNDNWLKLTADWMRRYPIVLPEYYEDQTIVHPYVFMKVLSDLLVPGDVIVSDCGGNAVVTFQAFETKWGQRLVSSHGNSPMGFAFAGAIGAALARPNQRIVCLIGDGGFNMNIQELQTVRNYNVKNLKVFIMNNHVYGITRQFQDTHFSSRYEASGPKGYNPPDFVPIVQAYGICAKHIQQPVNLWREIKGALEYDGTIVIDVDMGNYCKYEPRIAGWTPIEDMVPLLPLEEFVHNMIVPLVGRRLKIGDTEERAQWQREGGHASPHP